MQPGCPFHERVAWFLQKKEFFGQGESVFINDLPMS